MLFQLALDKAQRKLSGIDRHLAVEVFQKIRQRTCMVFMAMGNHNTAQFIGMLQYIRVVGQNKVNARVIVVGKHQTRIVKHHVVTAFERSHVLANSIKAAERNDAQLGLRVVLLAVVMLAALFTASVLGMMRFLALGRTFLLAIFLGLIVELRKLGALTLQMNVLYRFGGLRFFLSILRLVDFFSHVVPFRFTFLLHMHRCGLAT